MFWRCVGLILVLLGAGLFMVAQFGRLWPRPQARPKAETVVHERRLPSGAVCRVALVGEISAAGRTEKLGAFEVSIDGHPAYVSTESFSDLRDIAARDGVDLAEFARDTYVLLTGGEGATAWRAKFVIRDLQVTERGLSRGGKEPLVTCYPPPGVFVSGRISPAEVERMHKLVSPQAPQKGMP